MSLGGACALAAGVVAVLLFAGGTTLGIVATLVLLAGQVALLWWRPQSRGWQRFLLAWTGEAGLSHAVSGDPTVMSALVFLGVGLVFALVVVAALAAIDRIGGIDEGIDVDEVDVEVERPRSDTAPLPVTRDD